jgi:phosphatidylserine synthase
VCVSAKSCFGFVVLVDLIMEKKIKRFNWLFLAVFPVCGFGRLCGFEAPM